jgi:8-oxo-dGTP pyrophosphatase MutT (NUDIX family)
MNIFIKIVYQASRIILQIFKPMTNGVRLLLIREDQVLLVKHVYEDKWYLPGGLVEKGETLEAATCREAWEEVGAQMKDLRLFGVYTNFENGRTDHIAVFISKEFSLEGTPDHEIEEVSFYPFQALPEKTSSGSRNRIEELIAGTNNGYGRW